MAFTFRVQFSKLSVDDADYTIVSVTDNGKVFLFTPTSEDRYLIVPQDFGGGNAFLVRNLDSTNNVIVKMDNNSASFAGATSYTIAAGGFATFFCVLDGPGVDKFRISTEESIEINSPIGKRLGSTQIYIDSTKFADNTESATEVDAIVSLPTASESLDAADGVAIYTALDTDVDMGEKTVFLDGTDNACTATLPAGDAANAGKRVTFIAKNISNTLTLTVASGTLYGPGGTSGDIVFVAVGDSVTVVSDGTDWWIINEST